MSAAPRVLLVWPGCEGPASGNFGVPQLVLLATYARQVTGAHIEIRDLAMERLAFGPIDPAALFDGYDVIAFSVYSSFDLLKCEALASFARERAPDAVIVAGGYHASARPTDLIYDGSAFDVCVVGEGEHALVKIIESVAGGAPLRQTILASDPVHDLSSLPASDWSLLSRYRSVAREHASQAQVYLSRGCPFDCAFCMERAKREVSWRALPVERAVEEIVSLHEFLDLSTWTLYIADALFGMKKSWRRELLEALARAGVPVKKLWLLIRVDLVDDEDLRLFGDANCGLGFGLESGDPALLATIRKAGKLDTYLERMKELVAWTRERDVPWGANIIVGHPGETRESMHTSARYMRELFLDDPRGVTGFLSVDPFRLYPGSPIDTERGAWEARFGTRFHRTEWWQDGDQEFLSEWVDPSEDLDWRERTRLTHELLAPIVRGVEERFVYRGPARDYFLRAIRGQAELFEPASELHYLDRYYAWLRYLGWGRRADEERAQDGALRDLALRRRRAWRSTVAKRAKIDQGHPVLDRIEQVPRERFVPTDQILESTRDRPVRLDESGGANVSAMHAYARAFSLAEVAEGDIVADLGGGTGYGATLLAELVGETGRVVSVEVDPRLSALACTLVPDNVDCVAGDAMDVASWGVVPDVVVVGFAIDEIPEAWLAFLSEGARIVTPLNGEDGQRLARLRVGGALERFEPVHYVARRDEAPAPVRRTSAKRARTRLPTI